MQFLIGAAVFLSSMLLLAILARMASNNPDAAPLRGELLPALLSVLVTSGLTLGLLLMVFGGEGYFASRGVEAAAILGFAVASIWGIRKLVDRLPDMHSA